MIDIDELLNSSELFLTQFPEGWSFVYRLLSLKEYRLFAALRGAGTLHPFFIYKKVFERCYHGDPTLLNSQLPAGVVVTLGNLIMHLSGDCNRETLAQELEATRASYVADDVIEHMKRVCFYAFPNMDWQAFEQMTRPALIGLFVQAEYIVKQKNPEYKILDHTSIVDTNKLSKAPTEPKPRPIDFIAENQQLTEQLHPFDLADQAERDYAAAQERKAVKKLDPETAKKLDNIARRRKNS